MQDENLKVSYKLILTPADIGWPIPCPNDSRCKEFRGEGEGAVVDGELAILDGPGLPTEEGVIRGVVDRAFPAIGAEVVHRPDPDPLDVPDDHQQFGQEVEVVIDRDDRREMVRTMGKLTNAMGEENLEIRCKWTTPNRRCNMGNNMLWMTRATTPFELSVNPDNVV
ncbi:uncharacterized protein PGTG_18038 [Puccinia graminis f. sp. tritici CRL 75-36-700-3]|uniref:Uncharacterized protein n=1 Tax=Puccinia graminis f. sp. tritici (strain CRL 75-36-700-3 / race SCCL) TaxID=418459 RepID=E3L5L9_PUCGT|nr:uncharacterized protein PGTG_18038 [Puccinia graminis f. sp. tritici CRL 75-36-700-3]EFP91844.1 hypothetical protein PGTG_18038 [Puccinia graminis f. sp. tritici CRL 75-36-700-3]